MSVFNSMYANQYDNLYAEKNYSLECDLIESACAKYGRHPKTVLDIGCGTGSHVMELARRGMNCVGVDLSADMLDVAKSKAAKHKLQHAPNWVQGDAREFKASGPFELVTMMFAVVSYLITNDDVIAGLKNIRKHMQPGAMFICDFWYGPAVLSVRPNERVRVMEDKGIQTIRAASTVLNTFKQTANVNFRLWSIEGNQFTGCVEETHRMRYFFPQEFTLLLSMSGFNCLSLSSFPSLDAQLNDESWNAFCIATAV